MKIDYSHELPLSKQFAFETLIDPHNLRNIVPGCESFEYLGENSYLISSKVEFGPITGLYKSTMELIEINKPDMFQLIATGEGTGGSMKGELTIMFKEFPKTTQVVVNGNAEVTGFVATLGETLLERATITLLEKFFNSLKYNTKTYDK